MGAYINGDYKSEYSGDQIDAAIGKVRNPDSTPTASSDNLVTSGGVKAALDQKQAVIEDLSTIRSNATDGKAAYDKIDAGLAKSDLDAGVQASLDKADAAAPQSTTYTKTEVDNALATKAAKNGSGSENFNAKSVILPTTGVGTGTSQILGANSPVPGRYFLPDSASGGQGYTLATTDMVNPKADKDTDAVEGNLAEFDANGNPVDSGIPSTKIGEIEEEVSVLRNSAGVAEGIADTISAGTPQEFVFRQSGGDGVNYMKRIKGRSIVWNQLRQNPDTEVSTTFNNDGQVNLGDVIALHKYYLAADVKTTDNVKLSIWGSGASPASSGSGNYERLKTVATYLNASYTPSVFIQDGTPGNSVSHKNVIIIDLTLMFGAGNEPSTVAEFEALYPAPYYPYNAGTIVSNDAEAIETVGRNVWDEEWERGSYGWSNGQKEAGPYIRSKNFIPVISGKSYYINGNLVIFEYGVNKEYVRTKGAINRGAYTIPADVYYITFRTADEMSTYANDICINLSDASFDGQYEPYWKRRIEIGLKSFKVKSHNIWDEVWENGRIFVSTGANDNNSNGLRSKNYIAVISSQNYYINKGSVGNNAYALFYDVNKSYISYVDASSAPFAVPANAAYLRFYIPTSSAVTSYSNDICFNVSSSFNGNYEPYGDNGVITKTGGLPSAGSVYDEIVGNKYVKRVGSVDMGTLTYTSGTIHVFRSPISDIKKSATTTSVANLITPPYQADTPVRVNSINKTIASDETENKIAIRDESYSDAASFKTAMSGVMLNYELATPIEYELAEPIPNSILVDNLGTEQAIFPEHEDGSPSAPFCCDSNYSISVKNLVAFINAQNNG